MKIDHILLNIPHSSTIIPVNTWEGDISRCVQEWTDLHTDTLFAPSEPCAERVAPVIFPVSRFFCDAERLTDDPMEDIGQGIYYTDFEECHRENDDILCQYATQLHTWHRNLLGDYIKEDTLLIDCHSFPSKVAPGIHINIGFNNDWSRPSDELIQMVKEHFEASAYRVGINTPYSNSITPPSEHPYSSFMIELNKSIYMNEASGMMHPHATLLQNMIIQLYQKLLGF